MLGNTSTPFGQKPATPGFGSSLSQPTFGSPGASAFGTPQQSSFGQASTPSFGQTTAAPAFGQASSTPGFGQSSVFGQNTSTAGFGTGSTQPAFGAPATQSAFGAPTQPAFGIQTSQPAFGAQTSQPAFGAQTSQPAFGTQTPQPAFGAAPNQPAFGTQSAFGVSKTTSAFGAPSTTPAFGASTTTPAFGATASTPGFGTTTSSLTFGTPTTTSTFGTSSTPLTFGTNQQKPAFGATTTQSVTFGTNQTATTQASGFQFGSNLGQAGVTTTSATPALGTTGTQSSLAFSAPQTTSSSLFGTKPGTASFSTPGTTTQSSISFGSSLTQKPSTTQGSSGFTFGTTGSTPASTAASTTQSVNVNAGLSNFMTAGLSLGSVIGGKSILTITGNTATPLYSAKTADLQAGRSSGQIPPKCQNVPQQVLELVESFKNHMKVQKHLCLEVSRASLKPISKVSNDAENIKKSVMKLERAVNKNKLLETKLKEETVKTLADVEVAQKAIDVPGGFPSDNSFITDYFIQLAHKFQQQVLALRVELESTEKNILCELNPVAFTPQELSTTMQRLYECFVALAGRFQFVHAQISNLKVQHLELRKKKLEDYTDIFSKKNVINVSKPQIQASQLDGPTPFSGMGLRNINSVMSSLGYPLSDKVSSNNTLPMPNAANTSLFGSNLNQTLQNNNILSSSPQTSTPGSKRGKR